MNTYSADDVLDKVVAYLDYLGGEYHATIKLIEMDDRLPEGIAWVYLVDELYPETNNKIKVLNDGSILHYVEIRKSDEVYFI